MNIDNIVFIEYDGKNIPFQVWTDDMSMYDLRIKQGHLFAELSGMGGTTYIHKFSSKIKRPRKLWFKPDFRPYDSGNIKKGPLQNRDIYEYGYSIIENPTYLDEILEAIENY